MAEKAAQHLLPVVYQRSFADATRPPGLDPHVPFTPRVWLIPRALGEPARARAPKNAFVATRFYTLRDDVEAAPRIENALSVIEGRFGALLPLLRTRSELSLDDYVALVVFVGTLKSRTPQYLAHWQRQYEDMERVYRMVERGHTGTEIQADRLFWMQNEMAKRMLFEHAESYAAVVGPGGWLIVNESPLPMLSSDAPVVHAFLHRDELENIGFPSTRIPSDAPRTQRAFVSYCPLTPHLAFVSSPLLLPPDDSSYWPTTEARLVLGLNELVRAHSHEHVLSPSAEPYGPMTPLLIGMDKLYAEQRASGGHTGARIYTDHDRHWVTCGAFSHEEGPTPLHSQLRLLLTDSEGPKELSVGTVIRELELFEDGEPTGGMRGARIVELCTGAGAFILIEADPELAI